MEEGKLNMDNGDELPAFFPKKNKKEPNMKKKQPEPMPTAQDALIPIIDYGNLTGPIGPTGAQGLAGPLSDEDKEDMIIKLYQEVRENKVELDDIIDSDYITEPVSGEIYKAKSLDTICRYVSSDDEYHHLNFHDGSFYLKIKDNELLKTTALERGLYEQNEKL